MNKKNKLILVAIAGVITSDILSKVQKEHPDSDIEIRTHEEHAEKEKQNKVFEREPIKFTSNELFVPKIRTEFELKKSPIDAVAKPNRFGKHRNW